MLQIGSAFVAAATVAVILIIHAHGSAVPAYALLPELTWHDEFLEMLPELYRQD